MSDVQRTVQSLTLAVEVLKKKADRPGPFFEQFTYVAQLMAELAKAADEEDLADEFSRAHKSLMKIRSGFRFGDTWDSHLGNRMHDHVEKPSIWSKSLPEAIGNDFRRLAGLPLNEDVSSTIADQMGGIGRLKSMLGAQVFKRDNGIAIKWPSKQRSKGNYVEIDLNASDTYDVKFFNASGTAKKLVKEYDGIYADRLVDTFEKQTGYFLRL